MVMRRFFKFRLFIWESEERGLRDAKPPVPAPRSPPRSAGLFFRASNGRADRCQNKAAFLPEDRRERLIWEGGLCLPLLRLPPPLPKLKADLHPPRAFLYNPTDLPPNLYEYLVYLMTLCQAGSRSPVLFNLSHCCSKHSGR